MTAFEPTALLAERVQNISMYTVYIDMFCTRSAQRQSPAADCILLPKNLNFELAVRRTILWTNARNADHSYLRMYKMPNYISAD